MPWRAHMKFIFYVFLYLVATSALRAESIVGKSLEWLADTSMSIGVYRVTGSRKEADFHFELSFQLEDVLKGDPLRSTAASYWLRFREGAKPKVAPGDRFLVFLKPDDHDSPRVDHLINLSVSQDAGWDSVAINSKFEVLTDQAQILALVRARLQSHPTEAVFRRHDDFGSSLEVEVPGNTPAHYVLFSGSDCYLLVPDDLKPTKPSK